MADSEQREEVDTAGDASVEPSAIVGVAATAASLQSLVDLLSGLAPGGGAAYLIAIPRKDGLALGKVIKALERTANLPVTKAVDGERMTGDRIYVAGPDEFITIEDGHLRTRPGAEPAGNRGALDSLLISLAEHAHERAVAVLLAGLGSEGAAGIVATKKFGGLSIAETSDVDLTVQGGTDPAAVADLNLPADRIGAEIERYIGNLQPILLDEERDEESGDIEAKVTQVATILRNATSHDFHGYKRGTFLRRVNRRLQVLQIEGGIDAYIERLRSDREEVQHLFQDLLIGVTQFFRDPAEFETLGRELPRLFEKNGPDEQFRVWVIGCATGEEAYSLAILLREYAATLDKPPQIQVFATDLDARALSLARAGRYSDAISSHVGPDRLERWFVREGDTYCVSKELREMCIFSPHNIVKDAPFSRINILSCRNLLIYLSTDLQNRVIPIFHFALRSEGALFLGSSENLTRHHKLFAPVDRKSRVFRRVETATRIIPDFPLTQKARGGEMAKTPAFPAVEGWLPASISRHAASLADRYAPAFVIVDVHGDVLHFSGRTGRYLDPSAGAATLSLPSLVYRDLRLEVRTALQRAIAENRRVEVPRLTIRQGDRSFGVTLIVEPLAKGDVTALAVIFQDLGEMPEDGTADDDRFTSDEHVQRVEAELRVTKDRLQATIEELESTNEELKSSNEEYQSINEELQSASEEMETSKEELQSINEELQTVNGELAHRVHELGTTNSDLKNLLEATQIATVFLDNDLRVRNFTPAATDIFHLLDTDVGRPLDHVVSRVQYPELLDDVRAVLKTLVPVERQVVDTSLGRHFAARVLPYRSLDNYISGAVVTFNDLTAVRQAEAALRESEAVRRIALEGGRMGSWRWDLANRRVSGDPQFLALWGFSPSDDALPLSHFTDRMSREGADETEAIVTKAIQANEEFDASIEIVSGPTGGHWLRWRGRAPSDDTTMLYGVSFDITEQMQADARLRESEERFRAFVTASSDAVYRMSADWTEMRVLDGRGFIPDTEAPSDDWIERYIPAEDQERVRAALKSAIAKQEMFELEHRVRTVDGGFGWTHSRAVPILDDAGRVVEWFGTATDITDLHEATEALREAERRQQILIDGVPQLLWRAVDRGQWTWASPQWTAYSGQSEPESHGRHWLDTVHPDDREAALAAWDNAEEQGGFDLEYRIRSGEDGGFRWFRTRAVPVRNEQGAITEWLGTSTDVDETRALQKRQEVLVGELQHRVRNMLTVVRSVFSQTADSTDDLDQVVSHFQGRLDALARTQVIVTQNADGTADLGNLIRDELLSVGASEGPKLTVDGPDIALPSKAAESIGLAIHELTTNALKYGALKASGASLSVTWTTDVDQGNRRRLILTWIEKGVPAVSTKPPREGFGRELIEEALPYRLGAETKLEFLGGGVRCIICVPLPSIEDAAHQTGN